MDGCNNHTLTSLCWGLGSDGAGNGSLNGQVNVLALDGSGNLYVGGGFTKANRASIFWKILKKVMVILPVVKILPGSHRKTMEKFWLLEEKLTQEEQPWLLKNQFPEYYRHYPFSCL